MFSAESVRQLYDNWLAKIIADENARRLANYKQAHANWLLNAENARANGTAIPAAPAPPASVASYLFTGSTAVETAGPPVCEPLPGLPPINSPAPLPANNVDIGPADPFVPGRFHVGSEDTMPVGAVIYGPDGKGYVKTAIKGPWGFWVFYQIQ